MSTITYQEMKDTVTLALADSSNAPRSFISELGASAVQAGVTQLQTTTVSPTDLVGEGGKKGSTNVEIERTPFTKAKLVGGFRVTEEYEKAAEAGEFDSVVGTAINGMLKGIYVDLDTVITTGFSPSTGAVAVANKNVDIKSSLIGNSTESELVAGTKLSDFVKQTQLVPGIGQTNTALLHNGIISLVSEKSTEGYSLIDVRLDEEFILGFGLARYAELAKTVVNPKNKAGDKDVLAIVGDYSNIYRSLNVWDIRKFNSGSPDGGDDLGETNELYYRVEFDFTYAIVNPSEFTLITQA